MTIFAVLLSSSRLRKVTPLAVLGLCLITNIAALDFVEKIFEIRDYDYVRILYIIMH